MEWLGLIVVLGALVGVIPGVIEQYGEDRAGFFKTLRLMALYLIYVVAGIGVFLALLSSARSPLTAAASLVFIVGYIFYGALWLTRLVPRYRQVPAFIDKFPSVLDYITGTISASALAIALLG